MALRIVEIHPASDKDALNTEWFVLENQGDKPFSTKNCTLSVSRHGHKRRRELGILDPGFTLAPGERARVVTGNPGRKAHGKSPEDDLKNYNLFLGESVLQGPGTVLLFGLRSHILTTATFDPEREDGVAPEED
jgi:hypothetical protein